MAVPKKATSVSRKGKRRAGQHHKLYRKHPISCPNCGDFTLPHAVCSSCGTFKGMEVFKVSTGEEGENQESET
jgi:large subunit ribosomal protein L32